MLSYPNRGSQIFWLGIEVEGDCQANSIPGFTSLWLRVGKQTCQLPSRFLVGGKSQPPSIWCLKCFELHPNSLSSKLRLANLKSITKCRESALPSKLSAQSWGWRAECIIWSVRIDGEPRCSHLPLKWAGTSYKLAFTTTPEWRSNNCPRSLSLQRSTRIMNGIAYPSILRAFFEKWTT